MGKDLMICLVDLEHTYVEGCVGGQAVRGGGPTVVQSLEAGVKAKFGQTSYWTILK